MKFPIISFLRNRASGTVFVLASLAVLAVGASGQLVKGKALQVVAAPENVGYRLEQCANGQRGTPKNGCDVNNEWITGDVTASKAQYLEGDSLPYRLIITGLTPGSTGNTVTIQWDTTKQGIHAIDYITTYNRTESANPCTLNNQGDPICGPGVDTFPIPTDPDLPAGIQQSGNLTAFGGDITAVSAYALEGDYSGDSSRKLTITFDAGTTDTVVIAWGGHISTRADWGFGNSSINIPGSPYHTSLDNGRDVQLKLAAVLFPGIVTIIKQVVTPGGGTASTTAFPFSASANFGMTSFSLVDNDVSGPDAKINSNIQVFYPDPGSEITVQENINMLPANWTLIDVNCTEASTASSGFPSTHNSSGSAVTGIATIRVEPAESVQCIFRNSQLRPTAADAVVSGRVTTAFGRGISKARVTMTDAATGAERTVMTNGFGYYTFDQVESGRFYVLSVTAKGHKFADGQKSFTVNDNLADLDFIANP